MFNWILNLISKPVKSKTATDEFFDSLNSTIKNRTPVLEYFISNFENQEFIELHQSLEHLGFKPKMTSRAGYEFIYLNLNEYRGPRDQLIKPLAIAKKLQMPKLEPAPSVSLVSKQVKAFSLKPWAVILDFSTQNKNTTKSKLGANVITVDFRKKKKVS